MLSRPARRDSYFCGSRTRRGLPAYRRMIRRGGINRTGRIDESTAFTGGEVHGRSYDRNYSDSSGGGGDLEEKTG